MKGLTKQQAKILWYIESYITQNRLSPTYRDIMHHFALRSPATVYKHLQALHKKGFLTYDPKSPRSLQPTVPNRPTRESAEKEIPYIGTLHAERSFQLFSQSQTATVPSRMVVSPEKTYVVSVLGKGFVEELLADGDWLVVEAKRDVQNGDIVIALINAQVPLIKRYFIEEEYVRLEGIQKGYQPIVLHQNDIAVHGIIRGVLRFAISPPLPPEQNSPTPSLDGRQSNVSTRDSRQ